MSRPKASLSKAERPPARGQASEWPIDHEISQREKFLCPPAPVPTTRVADVKDPAADATGTGIRVGQA